MNHVHSPRFRGFRRALVLASVTLAVLGACGCRKETAASVSTRPVVSVVRVGRGRVARELAVQAELRPWFAVDQQARVAGYVRRLAVELGDRVEAGQLLAELDVPLLREDRARAEAVVARSESEVDRASALFAEAHQVGSRLSGVVAARPQLLAGQEVDSALARERAAAAALATAQRQVDVARAELKRFEAMEADSRMTAPIAGVIARLDASPGEFVQGGPAPSGQARPLLRLVQLDRLRCAFAVSVGEIGAIHRGDPVEIRLGKRTVNGRIDRIAGEVTPAGRTMMVEADVENADRSIVPGSYATAVLSADVRTNVLVLPMESLLRTAGGVTVLKVTADGKVESVALRTGIETADRVEVLEGLHEGDLIVTAGGGRVRPGQVVEARVAVAGTAVETK
jgi:hypothetical protein